MARLPVVAGDTNSWGSLLNAFLQIAHNADGSLKNLTYITDPAYGAVGDNGVTDNTTAVQNAINAVSAAGGGTVFVPPGNFGVASSIAPKSNVTLFGCGVSSVIFRTTTGNTIDGRSTVVNDFVLDSICFTGPVNQTVSVPTRARTTSGAGTQTAIYISGDLDLGLPGNASFTNLTLRNCIFKNCSALPIRIGGVRGKVIVTGCEFYNNQDVGFVYNQEVIFNGNHVLMSADNGVSISRGNTKITCNDNTFENCCYNGVWLAGYLTTLGPTNFTCNGNTIKNIGNNGIYLDQAPEYATITGNSIDCGYNRGPSDGPEDTYGFGIYVGGYPTSPRSSPTNYALGIVISANFVRTAPRGGIYLSGVQNFEIVGNLLLDIGTQYLADNVTAISSSDSTNNIGIYFESSTTVTSGVVALNHVVDSRGTPYCNFGIVPQTPQSSVQYSYNQMRGCRNAYNLQECDNATRVYNYTLLLNANLKAVQGATAGGNSQTGNVPGFNINGAPGSTRTFGVLSGGVVRWYFRGNNDAESGSNAGTNLQIDAYDDSGNLLTTPIKITRSSGHVALQTHIATAGSAPTIAAGAQSASASLSRGTDIGGTVTSTAVASPAAGVIATVTFANAYAATPNAIIITPTSSAAALAQLYISASSTTAFTVSSATATTNGATVSFSYVVMG